MGARVMDDASSRHVAAAHFGKPRVASHLLGLFLDGI